MSLPMTAVGPLKVRDEADLDGFLLGHGGSACEQQSDARGHQSLYAWISSLGPFSALIS